MYVELFYNFFRYYFNPIESDHIALVIFPCNRAFYVQTFIEWIETCGDNFLQPVFDCDYIFNEYVLFV